MLVADEEFEVNAPDIVGDQPQAFVGDKLVALSLTRLDNSLIVEGAGLWMRLKAIDEFESVLPLDVDGNIRLDSTRLLSFEMDGVDPSDEAKVWILSEPTLLMVEQPNVAGRIRTTMVVPDTVPDGFHRLVVETVNQSGDSVTAAMAVYVGDGSTRGTVGRIIAVSLTMAVLAALAIPATRRRRRREAPAL